MGCYPEPNFKSLHQIPQSVWYNDASGAIQQSQRTGYCNQHNLDDPIIRCSSVATCPMPSVINLTIPEIKGGINLFKVYVPPGTTNVSLSVMLDQPSYFAFTARFGCPPTGDYSRKMTDAEFNQLPTTGFKMSALKAGDCLGKNSSGFLKVAKDSKPAGITGGWLYVQLLPRSGRVYSNTFTVTVNTDAYMKWFRAVKWLANGDPSGGVTVPVIDPGPVVVDIVVSAAQWKAVQAGAKVNWIIRE